MFFVGCGEKWLAAVFAERKIQAIKEKEIEREKQRENDRRNGVFNTDYDRNLIPKNEKHEKNDKNSKNERNFEVDISLQSIIDRDREKDRERDREREKNKEDENVKDKKKLNSIPKNKSGVVREKIGSFDIFEKFEKSEIFDKFGNKEKVVDENKKSKGKRIRKVKKRKKKINQERGSGEAGGEGDEMEEEEEDEGEFEGEGERGRNGGRGRAEEGSDSALSNLMLTASIEQNNHNSNNNSSGYDNYNNDNNNNNQSSSSSSNNHNNNHNNINNNNNNNYSPHNNSLPLSLPLSLPQTGMSLHEVMLDLERTRELSKRSALSLQSNHESNLLNGSVEKSPISSFGTFFDPLSSTEEKGRHKVQDPRYVHTFITLLPDIYSVFIFHILIRVFFLRYDCSLIEF